MSGTGGEDEKSYGAVTVREDGCLLVRVRSPLPTAAQPHLLLQLRPKKGKPEEISRSLALEPAGRDQWQAVLEAAPPLEEGRWDAYVVGAPGEDRVPLLPGPRDVRTLVSGGDGAPAMPLAVRIPYATKDGRLAVRAWRRAAHAEAGRIVVGGDSVTVAAQLFGARLGDGAAVSLKRRGRGGAETRFPLRAAKGQDFSFTVDYTDLRPAVAETPVIWDVYVRPDTDAPRVRVARLLDDIADRKPVFVYPSTTLDGVSARPYFTVDNDLAVEVAPLRRR